MSSPATLTYKWEKVTSTGITGFSADTAANGTVTGTAANGDTIKVKVTYDEDGAAGPKTPASKEFTATAA